MKAALLISVLFMMGQVAMADNSSSGGTANNPAGINDGYQYSGPSYPCQGDNSSSGGTQNNPGGFTTNCYNSYGYSYGGGDNSSSGGTANHPAGL